MATEYDLIIVNGVVVTDTEIKECDIAVKDEKIAKIVPRGGLKDAKASKTIDAEGGYVMVILLLSFVFPYFAMPHFSSTISNYCTAWWRRRSRPPPRTSSVRERCYGRQL